MQLRLDKQTKWTRGLQLMCGVFQIDILERDSFEVLRLIRSLKNRLAPINKIPPEILALVPDFLDRKDTVPLTHNARLGGRCSYHGPLCGPILTARTGKKLASTSSAPSPPLSAYPSGVEARTSLPTIPSSK